MEGGTSLVIRPQCTRSTFLGEQCATKNDFIPSSVQGSGMKTQVYAPAPCHIAGDFRPLPGSRHFKQKRACFCLQTYS